MNQFPPSPWVFHLDRFEFFRKSRRYSRVKVHHRYQRHRWQICHRYQRHRWWIFLPFSLVLLRPAANLPTVSTIPAANLPPVSMIWQQYQAADTLKWTWRQKFIYMLTLLPKGVQKKLLKFFCLKVFPICHRCHWHRWQTLSCEYLREFLKKFEKAPMV